MRKILRYGKYVLALVGIGCWQVKGQSIEFPSNPDSAFQVVNNAGNRYNFYSEFLDTIRPEHGVAYRLAQRQIKLAYEKSGFEYRKKGLEFWRRFPNDKRKYEWLIRTVSDSKYGLHYWKCPEVAVDLYLQRENSLSSYSAELDFESLWQWEKLYPILRDDLIGYLKRTGTQTDPGISEKELLVAEIISFFNLSRNVSYRGQAFLSTVLIREAILEKMKVLLQKSENERHYFLNSFNNQLLSGYRFLGLNEDSLIHLLGDLVVQGDAQPSLKKWIRQAGNLMELMKKPMELRLRLPNGQIFDLQRWRPPNAIVLLDFWSLSCSSCISRMHYLKKLTEKYGDKGFIVLSLCANGEEDLARVEAVNRRIASDWKTLIIGTPNNKSGSEAKRIWNDYGFYGVPQMFLLDRSGKVALYNHELVEGDVEPFLHRLINQEL